MDKVSIIVPTYNEQKCISACIRSLFNQTYNFFEIIVVDDGSKDDTVKIIKKFRVKLFKQDHKGPGSARNLGAKYASGKILVFVDADMTFDKNFIKDLTKPISEGKSIGTFSKNEMNKNLKNIWSRCWQINKGLTLDRLIPPDYPNTAPVFRAILKREFQK